MDKDMDIDEDACTHNMVQTKTPHFSTRHLV